MEWSCQQIIGFLESYQAEPIIWDPHHKFHKDKKKVADAWGRLSIRMNSDVKELKSKKDVLMGTFRRHLKKKQESTRSGAGADDIYEPIWFAYPLMESFLLPIYTTRRTINTETEPSTSQVTFRDESYEGDEVETSDCLPTEETQTTSTKKTRRRTVTDPAEQQMASAFGQLTNALSQRQSQPTPKEDDECDLYAKLLAIKLREYSKDERKLIMYEIDGIFINRIKYGQSTRETPSPNYLSPLSRLSTPTTYSRPPSELNVHIPNQASRSPNSYSEPIIYAPKRPKTDQTPSVQSVHTYSIHPPSVPSANTYSIQPSNTYSIHPPSVSSANTYSIQPSNTYSIQPPSVQSAPTYPIQFPPEQSSNTYSNSEIPTISIPETKRRSNILNLAIMKTYETFESDLKLNSTKGYTN